jgi:CHASE2 domain-containing sensor protein
MTSMVLSLLTLLGIMGLHLTGALEALELMAYDGCLSARDHAAEADPRMTLVTITEEDIHEYGWPLSDGLLEQALKKLIQHDPRVIGLDIYRDFPEFPNFSETSTDKNLITRLAAYASLYEKLKKILVIILISVEAKNVQRFGETMMTYVKNYPLHLYSLHTPT